MQNIKNPNQNKNILVPKSNIYNLVSIESYAMLGNLSILMTKAEQFMYNFGLIENLSKQGFFIETKNKTAKIVLGKEFEPSLYRGQNDGRNRLIPSFMREKLVNDEVKHCIEFIKREEFKFAFQATPYFKNLSKLQILSFGASCVVSGATSSVFVGSVVSEKDVVSVVVVVLVSVVAAVFLVVFAVDFFVVVAVVPDASSIVPAVEVSIGAIGFVVVTVIVTVVAVPGIKVT